MPLKTLLCYAQQDERMVSKLKDHLSLLEHRRLIEIWDRGKISPGAEWGKQMENYLREAQIILLLISASFVASREQYGIEMQRAIERHERKEARVIPVILRPVLWRGAPLDKLHPLPDAARPILDWKTQDHGFANVAEGLAKVVDQWNTQSLPGLAPEREAFMAEFERFVEAVKTHLQPPGRADATAKTLHELHIFVPNEVTLADLAVGWRVLSQPAQEEEDGAIVSRRKTCGELADLATQITQSPGKLDGAIKTWTVWANVDEFRTQNDPRHATMLSTFARELRELQAATK